ncbi:MAG: OmpA family protein [Pyrinomonadaceae bacterium]|nr:OmpA family protein [Pyrinomonadaceae bacterium]
MKNRSFAKITLFFLMIVLSAGTLIAQVDVPRRTTAITYPLDELVMVQFRGTTRFPRMKGEAKVKRTSRNGTEVELSVSKMPRPFELGAGYATYVVWAVSPDGRADNLGEIKRRGFFEFDSRISVTTPLQTFALIITAEPHFLVRRPSQEIMMENLSPYTLSGKVIGTTSAVQYFGNSSDYFRDSRTPEIAEIDYAKMPSTILQAKQAVALARFAGAERDASVELAEAETLLQNADASWKAGRDAELVDIAARKSISAAVKAETTAQVRKEAREKRNEQSRADAEARRAEEKFVGAQGQIDDLKTELARETRARELAEREAMTYSTQVKELRDENGRLREEIGRMKLDAENAKAKLDAIEREKAAAQTQRDRETRFTKIRAAEPELINSLKRYGQVAKVDGSIVLVLNENLWTGTRAASLAMQSDGKLTAIGDLLASNPDYFIAIESHTDSGGDAETLQSLTDSRAKIVADKLIAMGVDEARVRSRGFAASIPLVANTTAANKAKNRRMHIILSLPTD